MEEITIIRRKSNKMRYEPTWRQQVTRTRRTMTVATKTFLLKIEKRESETEKVKIHWVILQRLLRMVVVVTKEKATKEPR